jgi:hypothetical protein
MHFHFLDGRMQLARNLRLEWATSFLRIVRVQLPETSTYTRCKTATYGLLVSSWTTTRYAVIGSQH